MISKPQVVHAQEQRTACIHLHIPRHEVGKHMDPAIREVLQVMGEQGLRPAGPMFSYHLRRPSDTFEFEIGFPIAGELKEEGRVKEGRLPEGEIACTTYQGPYEGLSEAWGELRTWIEQQGLGEGGRFWESYMNNPVEVDNPADYRTELNWVL